MTLRADLTQTGAGSSDPWPTNTYATPFNIGFGVETTGTVTYTVEHTFADPYQDAGLTGAVWFPHESVAAQSASQDGNYAFPVTAVRVTVSAGAGTATLRLVQQRAN